jgi:hypothetical protein
MFGPVLEAFEALARSEDFEFAKSPVDPLALAAAVV